MTNKKTNKLLAKIANMLEMAARTEGNEAEAANAARMAENLMRKHNLTRYLAILFIAEVHVYYAILTGQTNMNL